MALGRCGQICKWIIVLFNTILILLSLVVIGTAFYLCVSAQTPENLNTNFFFFVMVLCMTVSIVILIAAVFGNYGSTNENKLDLGIYCSLLTLLTTTAIVGGIVAYTYNKEFSTNAADFYGTIYGQYLVKGDVIRAFILKLFHNAFGCCGLGGIIDICPQSTNLLGISLAASSSCLHVITANLQASSVLGMFLGFAGVLLVVVACSSVMFYQIKGNPYRRTAMQYNP